MRKIFLTLAISSITLIVEAQTHSLGIQGGFNLTNIYGKNKSLDTKYMSGLIGGIKYELQLPSKFVFGMDMLYAQQGYLTNVIVLDQSGNSYWEKSNQKFSYNYLSLPLKFGYAFGKNFKFIPKIGIQPSFLLSAKTVLPNFYTSGNSRIEEKNSLRERTSLLDLAGMLELEIGYSINQNIDIFSSFSGRYSLTTLSNKNEFLESKFRHQAFSLLFGIKYKLVKS